MTILTDAEIADLHATWEESLIDTCTITPAVAVGETPTPFTVACAVVQPAGNAGPQSGGGGQLSQSNDVTILVPRGTDVNSGDRIAWGARAFSVGKVIQPTTYDPGILAQVVEVTA